MAEEAEAEGAEGAEDLEAEEDKKGGLFSNKLVLIGIVVVVLAVGGGLAFFLMSGGEEEVEISAVEADIEAERAAAEEVAKQIVFLELPLFTVNLSTPDGQPKYLRLQVALECSDAATLEAIQPLLPRIVDAFQVFLREIRPTDLEGSAGAFRLKNELLRRVNSSIEPNEVNQVLIKEFLIQ